MLFQKHLDGIDADYETQETIILYHTDPERWSALDPRTRAQMIAHYREKNLRESHIQAIQKIVAEEMKDKSPENGKTLYEPFSKWTKG